MDIAFKAHPFKIILLGRLSALSNLHGSEINIPVSGFHTEGGGGGPWNIPPPPARFPPPPQDFEIQYDVIIIIMYTMDIVQ